MNILQRLINNNYEFTFHEFFEGKYGAKYCSVCCEVICGPAYIAEKDGGNNMHKSCAELPGKIERHPFHSKHALTIQYSFNQNPVKDMICDGCSHVSLGLKFRCKICKFNLDFQCVSKHHHQGATLKEKVEKLIPKYHPHVLQLLYFSTFKARDSMFCCCCLKSILDSAYVCFLCKLFIHESCFDTIPERIISSFHPQHPLQRSIFSTAAEEPISYCQACGERVKWIELRCQKCECSFHVSCGKHTTPGLTLGDHKLFYLDYWDHSGDCGVCTNACEGGAAICRCIQHGESFHIDCILPSELSHESHDHPLTLTNSVVPRCNPDEYHCDVCETKGDFKRHVYHCEECYYIAHIECVLAEEDPPLKMILKSKDDLEQRNNNKVQEVEAEEQFEKMEEAEAKDDQEINESEESIDGDESEEIDDEEQMTKKLNKKAQDVKGKIDKLTFELKRIEEKLKTIIYKS